MEDKKKLSRKQVSLLMELERGLSDIGILLKGFEFTTKQPPTGDKEDDK
ncbi:MAG: hypothetical protein J3T61_00480 [Candidatus Brocadiales bacterium]|nr:hypothetical protein [Candidatus Bathyanammoxibius sp.]